MPVAGSASLAMSGTCRLPLLFAFCTPGPVCQLGLANTVLSPPPLPILRLGVLHADSDAYVLLPLRLSAVPPVPVMYGSSAGLSTARVEPPQSKAPLSPLAAKNDIPCAAACW